MPEKTDRIVITGAAGLVGQKSRDAAARGGAPETSVAIDKHSTSLATLQRLHPEVECVAANLAESGDWHGRFDGAHVAVQLHAQITGLTNEPFLRNNVTAISHVLDAIRAAAELLKRTRAGKIRDPRPAFA